MTGDALLSAVRKEFERYKQLGERAFAQVEPEDFAALPGPENNSIQVIVKHLAGNMRSRWTNVFEEDGEKPDRHRDTEFEDDSPDLDTTMARWNEGWGYVLGFLETIGPADLTRTIRIRGEPHTVTEALLRQLGHYAYHVGQIVDIARARAGSRWTSLSVPRGESEAFNRQHRFNR